MNPNQIQKLQENLLREKQLLESELSRFATKNPVVKDDYQARFPKSDQSDTSDEKAHSITNYEEGRAVEQSLEQRLKEIKETLLKIEAGAFGVCDKCQSPIEDKRLEAMPAAKFCIDCTKQEESKLV